MKKRIAYALLGLLFPFCQIFANDGLLDKNHPITENPTKADNLENWLEGRAIGNAIMVNFNISQVEFNTLIDQADISKIRIDFFWKSNAGDIIKPVGTETIEEISYMTLIENWSFPITPIDTNGYYMAQVALNEETCGPRVEIPLVEDLIEEEPDSADSLRMCKCGDPDPPVDTDATPLASAEIGSIFYIGGFPILVNQLASFTGDGYYSGEGIVPLPFKNAIVKVAFQDVFVNENGTITGGTVTPFKDDLANYPDFSVDPDTISIGGDICQPPPPPPGYDEDGINRVTGLSDWGFDSLGVHENGTIYDDNGFDINGNHKETGDSYNSQDCSREKKDRDGNPCNPSGGANPKAEEFADSIANDIGPKIDSILTVLTTLYQDSLATFNCGNTRAEMETLLSTLGYTRLFIFGEDDKYFKEGMHEDFATAPAPFLHTDIDRVADVKKLEDRHVDLYHCDKSTSEINTILAAIILLKTDETLDNTILEKIKGWSPYAYGLYTENPATFLDWLQRELTNILNENSGINNATTSIFNQNLDNPFQINQAPGMWMQNKLERYANFEVNNTASTIPKFQYDHGFNSYNTTAGLDASQLFDESFTLEDASFELRQGAEWINGVHKAFYLEGIAKQQYFNPSESNQNLLPITVSKNVGNRTYSIYLDNLVFTTNGVTLDAYAIIEDTETGRRLVFKGEGVSLGCNGLRGDTKLSLGTDVEIRLNNATLLVIRGNGGTNVAWDCDGFKSVSISAEIELCRDFIIPLDEGTLEPLPDPERYRIPIVLEELSGWLEFCLKIPNAKPFAVAGAEHIKWELTNLILDFSSEVTTQFNPLEGYVSPFYNKGTGMEPGWKGFYMQTLSATFPNNFSSNPDPTTVGAKDVLIDECGFTGSVFAENLISIGDGAVGGWPFSIDKFELSILKNSFGGASLGGQINVPLFTENMDYTAMMYPGNKYKFTVSPESDLTADVFLAKVTLEKDSKIEIGNPDGEFLAVATLNGKISIDSESAEQDSVKGLKVKFPKLCFQGFEVSNQSPYFSPGTWGIVGGSVDLSDVEVQAGFGGFGISLSNIIPFSSGEGEVGLGFNVAVELSTKKLGINAAGRLAITGGLQDNDGRQKWGFTGVDMNGLIIDASFPGASITGEIDWYKDDPIYGKGFRGLVKAKFEKFDVGISAMAQFGKIEEEDYKYFFVDALAELGVGIPIGPLDITGFGGGISYHMTKVQDEAKFFTTTGISLPSTIGKSLSGTTYIPSKDVCLGLKAAVALALKKDEIFNGTASLEFIFNCGDGFSEISFEGSGQLLNPADLLGLPPTIEVSNGTEVSPINFTSSLSFYQNLTMNFNKNTLDGDLEIFLDLSANGRTILAGTGGEGKLVDAQLHFGPDGWFIHIGRPYDGQTAGVKLDLGILKTVTETYLQIGTKTDPMRAIPSEVAEIAYKVNKNESLRTSGAGFIYGKSFSFELTAEIAKIISAKLAAKAGFDIMLRKYKGVSCADSGKPIGIDGWYAVGQMYAYINGSLQVFGVNVLEAGVAAVLQARLPNPFFAQATVGVKLKVGLIKVKKSLSLKLGNDCILVTPPDAELGMEVISHLTPSDGEGEVETNAQPAIYFNLALDKDYKISSLSGEETYKVILSEESVSLTNKSGNDFPVSFVYSEDKASVKLIPAYTFTGSDSITFKVVVAVYKNGQFFKNETKEITFGTADELAYIPTSNIKAAYPANGMANFYKNQYSRGGYIELVTGQINLFPEEADGAKQQIRLTAENGETHFIDLAYDPFNNSITYPLDPAILQPEQLYKLEVLSINGAAPIPTNSFSEPSIDDNTVANTPTEDALYTVYFRVSKYNTFGTKIQAIANGTDGANSGRLPTSNLAINLPVGEHFDALEIKGNNQTEPLIRLTVELNNPWLKQDVFPFLDELNEINPCIYLDEKEQLKQSVTISGRSGQIIIDANHFSTANFAFQGTQAITFALEKGVSDLTDFYKQSLSVCTSGSLDTQLALCREADSTAEECAQQLGYSQQGYPVMRSGEYVVYAKYALPGSVSSTTSRIKFTK